MQNISFRSAAITRRVANQIQAHAINDRPNRIKFFTNNSAERIH